MMPYILSEINVGLKINDSLFASNMVPVLECCSEYENFSDQNPVYELAFYIKQPYFEQQSLKDIMLNVEN